MIVSMDKKYTTRLGKEVRILAVDLPGNYPVVYAETEDFPATGVTVRTTTREGEYYPTGGQSNKDLIEKKEKKTLTYWLVIQSHLDGISYWGDGAEKDARDFQKSHPEDQVVGPLTVTIEV